MYKVSVITILKRRHKKIQENLKSLINQTLSDVEIICIYNEENSEINFEDNRELDELPFK